MQNDDYKEIKQFKSIKCDTLCGILTFKSRFFEYLNDYDCALGFACQSASEEMKTIETEVMDFLLDRYINIVNPNTDFNIS